MEMEHRREADCFKWGGQWKKTDMRNLIMWREKKIGGTE
jgi:hypothetical protein